MAEKFKEHYEILEDEYEFESMKCPIGWKEVEKYHEKCVEKKYKQNAQCIYFKINPRVWYNNDFRSFIIQPRDAKDKQNIKNNVIEKWSPVIFKD